jgi:DHA1 family bicyclomycin/chloramphenicol resistance-like MFS transporter
MAMGGVATALVSALHNSTALPMVAVMVGCVFMGLLLLISGKATVNYRARKNQDDETALMI